MSGATGMRRHFAARWQAVKAKRLRESGASDKEIAVSLGVSVWAANRYANWSGEGPLFPVPNRGARSRK